MLNEIARFNQSNTNLLHQCYEPMFQKPEFCQKIDKQIESVANEWGHR